MDKTDQLPVLFFETQAAWEAWLAEHHQGAQGAWLKFAKKGAGIPSLDYLGAVECALCYGWIDGRANAVDEQFWMVRFTPRKPKSIWSKVNVGRVEQLIAQGRMQPAGLREVEAAKADGRWAAAYDGQSKIEVPEDFQRELDQHPEAQAFFDTLSKSNRYAVLFRIQTAKRPETRAKRIQSILEMLLRKETYH